MYKGFVVDDIFLAEVLYYVCPVREFSFFKWNLQSFMSRIPLSVFLSLSLFLSLARPVKKNLTVLGFVPGQKSTNLCTSYCIQHKKESFINVIRKRFYFISLHTKYKRKLQSQVSKIIINMVIIKIIGD